MRERSTELEREVAERDVTLAERVEELNAAAAELSEVRGALERRGEALASAERARDDADRRVRTLEEAERASR